MCTAFDTVICNDFINKVKLMQNILDVHVHNKCKTILLRGKVDHEHSV